MSRATRWSLACVLAIGTVATSASASDPLGVYCIVDKVVLEPSDYPDRAQIWGACAIADRNFVNGSFSAPAKGYFYYAIPLGKEEIVRAEWNDLRQASGTGALVGYGRRYQPVGRFRGSADRVESPDPYPVHMGVLRVGPQIPGHLRELADALKLVARNR
jgi:hypothetical protein